MTSVDQTWFTERLEHRQLSQRRLAKLMGLDPAAVSLMFRGKRKIALEEASQLAVLLDVPVTEVLERAGLHVHGERRIKMVGTLNASGEVSMSGEGAHDLVEAPPGVPSDCVAIQARTTGTDQEALDGWIYFVSNAHGSPGQTIGHLAMVAIKGNGVRFATVKRGYTRGTYNLINYRQEVTPNVELAWASPILWIKTTA